VEKSNHHFHEQEKSPYSTKSMAKSKREMLVQEPLQETFKGLGRKNTFLGLKSRLV
jgi:hypothetical protein